MPTDAETLEVAGRDIRVTNPTKVYFPDAPGGPITQARARPLLDRRGRRRARRVPRSPDDAPPVPRRGGRRGLLPEAAPQGRAPVGRDRPDHVPERTDGEHARDRRCRAPGVGRDARLPGDQPVARPRRRRRPSRRAPGGPRPDARGSVRRRPADRDRREGRARRARLGRLPEDERQEGDPRERADPSRVDVHRGAEGGARPRARSSAASPSSRRPRGGRRSATACSSTTTRTRATGPWRPPTASARSRTRASPPRSPGTRCPTSIRVRTRSARSPTGSATTGDAGVAIDEHVGSLEAAFELADRQEAEGLGEAPYPPHFPKAEGEPVRRAAVTTPEARRRGQGHGPAARAGKTSGPTGRRRTKMPLIEVARAETEREALEGLERWKAKHPGGRAAPRGHRRDGRRDAGSQHDRGRGSVSTCATSRGTAPRTGGAGGRLRPVGRGRVVGRGTRAVAPASDRFGPGPVGGRLPELSPGARGRLPASRQRRNVAACRIRAVDRSIERDLAASAEVRPTPCPCRGDHRLWPPGARMPRATSPRRGDRAAPGARAAPSP